MKNWFKKLFIPSGAKTTVVAYNSWVVRWQKIDIHQWNWGSFSYTSLPESEIFPSEEDANKFAGQLREAYVLLRYKGNGIMVKVESNQSKLATLPQ